MNRFEALHALGLDETATEQDVRLAYYGIAKAVDSQDFGEEQLAPQVKGMLNRAKQARDFLLVNGTQSGQRVSAASRFAQAAKSSKPEKLSITSSEDAQARLTGFDRLRMQLLGYRDTQLSRRNMSIILIVVCIAVGFIVLRYVRAMAPRMTATVIIAIFAIIGSVTLTTAQKHCRTVNAHLLDINARMAELRVKLGIAEPLETDDRPPTIWESIKIFFSNLAAKVRELLDKNKGDETDE